MSPRERPDHLPQPTAAQQAPGPDVEESAEPGARGGHGWMMLICCIPMLLIAVILVATGVVSADFLLVAVACTAMMGMMMRGMNHRH